MSATTIVLVAVTVVEAVATAACLFAGTKFLWGESSARNGERKSMKTRLIKAVEAYKAEQKKDNE